MYWTGKHGGVFWHYSTGGPTHDDWAGYIELLQTVVNQALSGQKTALLNILYRSSWPSRSQQKVAKAVLDRLKKDGADLATHAFVSDNRLHAITMKATKVIRGPIGAERVFFRPRPAVVWLGELGYSITVEGFASEIRRRIPSEYLGADLFRLDSLP